MVKQLNIHQKLKTKLFRDVVSLLDKNKVPFWLDFDTLLGVWGTKNGMDLGCEKDIYLSVDQKHLTILQNALKKPGVLYRVHSYLNRSRRKWLPGSVITLGVLNSWGKKDFSNKVLISIKYKQKNEFRWVDIRNCKHINSKYFDKLDKFEFDGKTYNIPSQTDEYLNHRYGNWQSIPQNWMTQIDDGTLAKDSLIRSTYVNKIENEIPVEKIKLQDSNNLPRMKEMLLFTIDQLQKNNIPFWIEAGTLLGIVRDGDLIPWDYDADISIPAEYSDKAAALRYKFFPRYIVLKRKIKTYNRCWVPGETRVVKIKTSWEKLQQVNFHIDLFCVYKVNDKYHWVDSGVLKCVDEKFFDTLEEIVWEGRKIPVPAHTEEYLSLRYGNWKIPDKNYIAEIHDGAIAERGF